MREGIFELLVSRVTNSNQSDDGIGENFQEKTINGISYAYGDPGVEYCVRVNCYRNEDRIFSPSRIRIDGNDCQYWKRIDMSQEHLLPRDHTVPISATFWGFKINVNDIRSFVFSTPKDSENITSTPSTTSASTLKALGKIQVVIFEAIVDPGKHFENTKGQHDIPGEQSISNGKKFYQQASLGTSAGKKIPKDREQFNPLDKWKNANPNGPPLHSMTLSYHTKSTLDCIEALGGVDSDSNRKRSLSNEGGGQGVSKRSCSSNEVYDLTGDDSGDEGDRRQENSSNSNNTSNNASSNSSSNDNSDDSNNGNSNSTVNSSNYRNGNNNNENHDDDNDNNSNNPHNEDANNSFKVESANNNKAEIVYEDEDEEIQYLEPVPKVFEVYDITEDDDE